jgi:small redox-active disulfide protein 2
MKIEVLGSGCPTCRKLYEITKKAAEELGIKDEVEYVSGPKGIERLIELGAMSSPAIAVDNKIVFVGYTPDIERIKKLLRR